MKIIKIGGSTIKSTSDLEIAINYLISNYPSSEQLVIIISAFHKLTKLLKDSVYKILDNPDNYSNELNNIKLFLNIFNNKNTKILLQSHIKSLESLLFAVSVLEDCSDKLMDNILSYGDLISSEIFYIELKQSWADCEYINSQEIFITNSNFGKADVIIDSTLGNIKKHIKDKTTILAGYIGSDSLSNPTTLGMENSNLSAILCSIALETKSCLFITDTKAIYQIDPILTESDSINNLNYKDALALAENGLKLFTTEQIELSEQYKIELIYTSYYSDNLQTKINDKTSDYKYILIIDNSKATIFSPKSTELISSIMTNKDNEIIEANIKPKKNKIILYFQNEIDLNKIKSIKTILDIS